MNENAKFIIRILAPYAIAYATLLVVGHAMHRIEMKKMDKEYKELCETEKV
jgi:hypothetical protein